MKRCSNRRFLRAHNMEHYTLPREEHHNSRFYRDATIPKRPAARLVRCAPFLYNGRSLALPFGNRRGGWMVGSCSNGLKTQNQLQSATRRLSALGRSCFNTLVFGPFGSTGWRTGCTGMVISFWHVRFRSMPGIAQALKFIPEPQSATGFSLITAWAW